MDKQDVLEIIACLPRDRTVFQYYKDRYAFALLARAMPLHPSLHALRASRFRALLEKPVVRDYLAAIDVDAFLQFGAASYWPTGPRQSYSQSYTLTLSGWGYPRAWRYNQTSRRGFNLVLQLNLDSGALARFKRLVPHPLDYNWSGHPICVRRDQPHRETLAWARLDVSFDTDEVLIEEIQSDFIRYVEWRRRDHADHDAVRRFVRPYRETWQEAMLTATLEFIWHELGITNVYYHEYNTGCTLKGIRGRRPPRSIYEQLPRKFCMTKATKIPEFLRQDRAAYRLLKRLSDPRFYSHGETLKRPTVELRRERNEQQQTCR